MQGAKPSKKDSKIPGLQAFVAGVRRLALSHLARKGAPTPSPARCASALKRSMHSGDPSAHSTP